MKLISYIVHNSFKKELDAGLMTVMSISLIKFSTAHEDIFNDFVEKKVEYVSLA